MYLNCFVCVGGWGGGRHTCLYSGITPDFSHGSLLVVFGGAYVVPGIEPGLTLCNITILSSQMNAPHSFIL